MACSVSIRKLPMSALRCRRSATRPSSRAPVERKRDQADWQRRQRDGGEPPVEPDHHHEAADQEQDVADPGQRRFGGDALDLADVVVDARRRCRRAGCARRSAATGAAGAHTATGACRTGSPPTRACSAGRSSTLSMKPRMPRPRTSRRCAAARRDRGRSARDRSDPSRDTE